MPSRDTRVKDRRNNLRKSRLMGIPIGTASNRLRKDVMFMLVCRCGMGTCFRCGLPIESAGELSIEHKDSWQASNDPLASFFDLANIAFSHLRCNILASSKPNKRFNSLAEKEAAYRGRRTELERARYTPERRRSKYLRCGN